MARRDRFPPEVLFRIESMVQFIAGQIIARHRELPAETRRANSALAYFLRYCLSLTDRHVIMNEIHYLIDRLDASDSRVYSLIQFVCLFIWTMLSYVCFRRFEYTSWSYFGF